MAKWINQKKEEVECEVTVYAGMVNVLSEKGHQLNFPASKVEIKDFHHELRLILPDRQEVLVFDPKTQKEIKKARGGFLSSMGKQSKASSSRSTVFSLISLLVGLSAAAYIMAPTIAHMLPRDWEEPLGETIYDGMDLETCDTRIYDPIHASLMDRFGVESGLRQFIKVSVVKSDTKNAIALPGGRIVLYSGLLKDMDSPEQYAAVLGHEISHQESRHFAAGIARAVLLTGVWHIVLGDLTGVLFLDPMTIMNLIDRSYSRAQETSADEGAARYLNNAGISLEPGASFLNKLSKLSGEIPEFLSTHPLDGRGEAFLSYQQAGASSTAFSREQFERLKKSCGL